MTLKELQEQVKTDLKIDGSELTFEAIRTPEIHHTYNKMFMTEKMAFKKLEREWDQLYLERWEYYRKKAEPEVYQEKPLLKKILDTDVKYYLAADEELQELRSKMDNKEELIDFLKRTMDSIAMRQWLIKAANDNNRYLVGDK